MTSAAEALLKTLQRRLRRACIKLQCAFARGRRSRLGIFHTK